MRFDVHLSGKGQPQASNLESDESQPPAAAVSQESDGKPDVELGSFMGVIKSFSHETGYGFISCAALRAQGQQRDVFVHHLQIQGLKVSFGVRFEAYLDKKSRLKAKSLSAAEQCRPLRAGATVITKQSVESIGSGYIAVGIGAVVEVLYVGSAETEDADWLYVKDSLNGEQGWMPCSAVAEQEEPRVQGSGHLAESDAGQSPEQSVGADAEHSSASDACEIAAGTAVVAEPVQEPPIAISGVSHGVADSEIATAKPLAPAAVIPSEPGASKAASVATGGCTDKGSRPRLTPEEAAAKAAADAKRLENELDSDSGSEFICPPPPSRPCPQEETSECEEAEYVRPPVDASSATREAPEEEKNEEGKPKDEKPKDELAVLAAATPLRNISLGATLSSLERALAVAEEVGIQLLGAGGSSWNYELIDKERRSFVGYLPGALDEKSAWKWMKTILDDMDEIGGWDHPMSALGRVSRGTKWLVQPGCRCPYRYGGMSMDPVPFPKWMRGLMEVCMPMCGLQDPESWPNGCNLNFYADGSDSLDWHADDEPMLGGCDSDCRIISLSFGAERSFEVRLADETAAASGTECTECQLRLRSGDLCTMEGLTQRHYVHRLPKAGGKIPRRLNLTWRWVVAHESWCYCSGS